MASVDEFKSRIPIARNHNELGCLPTSAVLARFVWGPFRHPRRIDVQSKMRALQKELLYAACAADEGMHARLFRSFQTLEVSLLRTPSAEQVSWKTAAHALQSMSELVARCIPATNTSFTERWILHWAALATCTSHMIPLVKFLSPEEYAAAIAIANVCLREFRTRYLSSELAATSAWALRMPETTTPPAAARTSWLPLANAALNLKETRGGGEGGGGEAALVPAAAAAAAATSAPMVEILFDGVAMAESPFDVTVDGYRLHTMLVMEMEAFEANSAVSRAIEGMEIAGAFVKLPRPLVLQWAHNEASFPWYASTSAVEEVVADSMGGEGSAEGAEEGAEEEEAGELILASSDAFHLLLTEKASDTQRFPHAALAAGNVWFECTAGLVWWFFERGYHKSSDIDRVELQSQLALAEVRRQWASMTSGRTTPFRTTTTPPA